MERRSPPRQEPGHLHRRGRNGREMREAAAPRPTPGQGTGGAKTGEHGAGRILIGGSTRTLRLLPQRRINQTEMEAQQTDTVQDAVWQLDQMEISTDEEECSLETPTPAATGAMEGGVRIDPTDLFDVPLTMSDLPEDSSKAEKLSKMMTAALRHKPGDFQIELQPDGFVRLETLAQSAQFSRLGATSRMLAAVVRSISKKRFIFTMRRGDIHVAATHGHSEGVLITQDTLVEISPSRAPEFAYHATKFSRWHDILSQGLLKMGRTHVHLAVKPTQQEGLRGGQDLLIVVRCQELVKSGIRLYRTATKVLLTPGVTTGGLLPLHFIHEVATSRLGRYRTGLRLQGTTPYG